MSLDTATRAIVPSAERRVTKYSTRVPRPCKTTKPFDTTTPSAEPLYGGRPSHREVATIVPVTISRTVRTPNAIRPDREASNLFIDKRPRVARFIANLRPTCVDHARWQVRSCFFHTGRIEDHLAGSRVNCNADRPIVAIVDSLSHLR